MKLRSVCYCAGGDGASDQDPFLAFTTQSHYGNIIVNVNNGVQCVGGSSIATGFQRDKPPPYSEVVNRGSDLPPPPYSTIDRANQRRQNGSGDGASTSGICRQGGGGSSPGLFPVNGTGVAVVGPPLAHPARQQYLQRNSTGSQDAGGNGSRPVSGSTDQQSGSQRNSTTTDSQGPAEDSSQPASSQSPPSPLPPPPPPPPSSSSQQQSQEGQDPPVPPPRSTSIVDSQAEQALPRPQATQPPPLPPRNEPLPPSTPPATASPSLGAGNLVVQKGKIVLASSSPSSPSPSMSTNSATSNQAASSTDTDVAAPAPGKLEVRQGQIILNMNPSGEDSVGRSKPQLSQGTASGGCELQVKDGKIIFKR